VKKVFCAIALACLAAGFSARAQGVTNPNHTVVRFDISTGGTNFGSIDLELFDQEKPQTVQNFLGYVYQGVYSNLVIQRFEPNFVLQGGHVTVTNPASTAVLDHYAPGRNFGPIPNEYSVGPELSNEYGTIAMARVSGQTNSASADWFLNLTNNSFLDSVDGGFTVFGRVVHTVNDRTGTNLLNVLNTVSNGFAISSDPFEIFSELPVSFARSSAEYRDLFVVNATILQSPQMPAPHRPVARLDITVGNANFGRIDIELFDQEKPETVRNFLAYVYSGSYSNTLFHQLEPNRILQAGHVQINDPSGNGGLTTFDRTPSFGTISNEYSAGPQLPNDFGTIALVPQSTYGESIGSLDWVFNLTNNSAFNTNNGYVVFGRVVNSYGKYAGTNLLNYFNTFEFENFGATNGTVRGITIGGAGESFSVPVTKAFRQRFPLTSEVFLFQASLVQSDGPRDTNAPTIQVNQTNGTPTTTNGTIFLSGTAADNQSVAHVLYDFGVPYRRFIADGNESWSANITLTPGTNQIILRSLDDFGNLSPVVQRSVFYSVRRPISLTTIGKGKVAGVTNGQMLELNVTYQFTATPAHGYYFNGWRGDGFADSRTVFVTMQEGLKLVVRFSKTLLGLATGTYEGVFSPDTNGPPNSSGFISIKLGAGGIYSGRLKPLGANYFIRGKIDPITGRSLIGGTLGTNQLLLEVDLADEGSEELVGAYSDGHFFSPFTLWRVQSFDATNPAPVGNYTFTLSPPLDTNNAAFGSGSGTMTIDAKGGIQITGTLGDGAAINQKDALLKGNRFPFYFTVKNGDSVLGLATFATNNTFSADVKWFAPNFPGGTNQNVKLNGAPAP